MSKVVKGFSKVVKKTFKAVRKVVRSVGKVFKKVFSSKIGKVVLAAAAVFTAGAAMGLWSGWGALFGQGGAAAAGASSAAAGTSVPAIVGADLGGAILSGTSMPGAVSGAGGVLAAPGSTLAGTAAGTTAAGAGAGLGAGASAAAAADAGSLLAAPGQTIGGGSAGGAAAEGGVAGAGGSLGGANAAPATGIESTLGDGIGGTLDTGVVPDVVNDDLAAQMLEGSGTLSPGQAGTDSIYGLSQSESGIPELLQVGAEEAPKGLLGRVMQAGSKLSKFAQENKLATAMAINGLAAGFQKSDYDIMKEQQKREDRLSRAAYDGIENIGSPLGGRRLGELRRSSTGERVYNDNGGLLRSRMAGM